IKDVEIIAKDVIVPYYLYLRADGIMYVRISSEKEESVDLVKKMVKKMGEMVNYKKVPLLAKHEDFALPGKENRDYWATKESCPYSKADAFMVNTTALQLIANFYLKFNKPARPTKMFDDEKEAINWLKTFL
ncbi:MAG: hypothetical protein IT235_05575, partial [Bacteroidia bacterium]|nr:hypothetical protein [Bacteroidia bacterium]